MEGRLTKNISDQCIIISYHIPNIFGLASATISNMGNEWYFNRLVVHEKMRNKGVATLLMDELIKVLDEKQITLINDINPYGDLNFKQLEIFYKKYGFIETEEKSRLIRYPKVE
jgi:GNAT superfamily N-acetyltransferase